VFDGFVELLARGLTWTFLIGMVGCVVVIPVVALQLFSVLFEKDRPEED
jgi:hypothetical protein